MHQLFRPLPCLFVLAALAGTSSDALAARPKQIQQEKKSAAASPARPERPAAKKEEKSARKDDKTAKQELKPQHAHVAKRHKKGRDEDKSAEKKPELSGDQAAVKDVMDLARRGKTNDATDAEKKITDPAAQKLAEWFILRHSESQALFSRYLTFITDNPEWPGTTLLRRRAESRLWQEKSDAATVHAFTGDRPLTARGRFALARVKLDEGDRDGAQRLVREAYRSGELTERTESDVLDAFRDLLGREDHMARMDQRLGAKDFSGAMRAAKRVGDDAVSIVKACSAVKGDDKASDRLDAVAADARGDLGYVLCRVQYLMRKDRILEAARVILAAPKETMALQDTDEWWRVRRLLARKLLDLRDYQTAYELTYDAAMPASDAYRADSQFMPGWIALRYLDDPKTARAYFARIDEGATNPITLARANYWRGRAAEALGDRGAMRKYYEMSARYPTAYYGQLSRAKLGIDRIELRMPPQPQLASSSTVADEIVRAADLLYAIGEREIVVAFGADLAEQSTDVPAMSALAEEMGRHDDARAMLELGKTALGRGLPLDAYAFPTIGIPRHTQFGEPIDRSVIYSVARTESAFNQRDRSSAMAVGLMQVTPEAGKDTAKRFKVKYDWDKMVSDPVYNTQMGAAEISALLAEYRGNFIMTFAGYNAGRGRVRDWIKAYGDPRDPAVDPVDWAERIPFSETRNYVQRVMENLLVYQHRFESGAPVVAKSQQQAPAVPQEITNAAPER
ncbi:MAG TPA: transglycosylase SLT domain-containing protein [Bradyrhizobium sp.]